MRCKVKNIVILIHITQAFIAFSCFGTLFTLALYCPPQNTVKVYERFQHHLKEQKNSWFGFNYRKIEQFLSKTGAKYHIGKKIEPIKYQAIRLLIGCIGLGFGMKYHLIAGILMFFLSYQIPKMYLLYTNHQDNEKLLPHIKLVYNSLAMQIKSGIFITDALTEAYTYINIENQRLYDALQELSGNILLNKDVEVALDELQASFDNRQIDSLCIILKQALESGQAVELLQDISEQIKNMEVVVLAKKKSKLDRQVTICLLGIMAVMLGIVIYACLLEMFAAVAAF